MELNFIQQDGVFNEGTNRVRFFALDGQRSVMFAITREALEDLAGQETLSPEQLTATFRDKRGRIEEIARAIYAAQKSDSMAAYVIGPGNMGRL